MRVPSPAAITTAAKSLMKLGRQDSNLGSRDQNPLPYQLGYAPPRAVSQFTTALEVGPCATRSGLDGRRRDRRLGTWLRPTRKVSQFSGPPKSAAATRRSGLDGRRRDRRLGTWLRPTNWRPRS